MLRRFVSRQDSEEEESNSSSASSDTSSESGDPPAYHLVLLEHHLDMAKRYPDLYPSELMSAIQSFLFHPTLPPPHPYRTFHSIPKLDFPEGSGNYFGELDPKRRRHGFGNMIYVNGDTYQGYWRKNVREGMGSYFWAETGSVYTGVWKSNERGGRGLFVFGPRRPGGGGVVYGGEWSKGRMHGKGRIIFIDEHNRVQTLNEVDMKKLVRDGRNDIVRF